MLSRLFKKARLDDLREQYRRTVGRGSPLGVKLVCADGSPVSGSLVDLSAGGAAIEFDKRFPADELHVGDVRELVFVSLTKSSVRAYAQVRREPAEGEPMRYGFQFIDAHALFEAIDDSFYKFFNRRRFRRAKPGMGENLRAEVSFGDITKSVKVDDVSIGGIAFHADDELAGLLTPDMPVEVRLQIPKSEYVLTHYGTIRHMSRTNTGTRIGMSIDVVPGADSKRTTKKAQAALADYIEQRLDEMDRYNSAYH